MVKSKLARGLRRGQRLAPLAAIKELYIDDCVIHVTPGIIVGHDELVHAVESGDPPELGGGDSCEGGNSRCAQETLHRWKPGAPSKHPAPFLPRIRIRQEPSEAQSSAGLMSTSMRSHITLGIVVSMGAGR